MGTVTFAFIRCHATRAACQRELLWADLRQARIDHTATRRLLDRISRATFEALKARKDAG